MSSDNRSPLAQRPVQPRHPRLRRPPVPHRRRPARPGLRRRRHALVGRGAGRAAPLGPRRPPAARLASPGRAGHALGVQPRRAVIWPPPATICPSGTSTAGELEASLAAAVLGDGRRLLARRRSCWPPATTTAPSACGTGAARPGSGNPRPPIGRQRPGVQPGRRPPGLGRRGPGHSLVGREDGPAARQPDRPHRPHSRPGLASRRPPALLRRLGHHGPRLGRGEVRADHPAQQPRRPGPRAGPERRRRPAGLHRFGPRHPHLGHEPQPRGAAYCRRRPARSAPWPSAPTAGGWRPAGTEHIIHLWDSEKAQQEGAADDSLDHARRRRAQPGQSAARSRWGPGPRWACGERRTRRPAPALEGAGELRAFAASPDGKWIAGSRAGDDERGEATLGPVGRRHAAAASRLLEGQGGPVTALAFSADSGLLATGGLPQRRRLALERSRRPAGAGHPRRGRRLLGRGAGVPSDQARAGGGRHRLDGGQRRRRLRRLVGRGAAAAGRRFPRRRRRPGVPSRRPAACRRLAGADGPRLGSG